MALYRFVVCVFLLSSALCSLTEGRVSVKSTIERLFRLASSSLRGGDGPSVNVACVAAHCTLQSVGCAASSECRNAMSCSQKCLNLWDNDTTTGKIIVQNCSNACSFTYGGKAYENFMECVTDHECIAFPPIPNTCLGNAKVHPQKMLTLKDMEGSWWVVRGYHPIYDCYPCQHLSIAPLNSTTWAYRPKYQVQLTNGSLLLVSQEMLLPNVSVPGSNISFIYHDMGLDHHETWWLLDKAADGSYMMMYYCGNTLQWYYEGALVLAKDRTLDAQMYADISTFQKAVGLQLDGFCSINTSTSCPD